MSRCAGILMSISSLPSPYGFGTIGKAAYDFADFLKAAGQKIWQILPVGPTSYGDSPYQSFSTYAGNPYMIDIDKLVEDGLLTKKDLEGRAWGENPEEVDYAQIYETKFSVLRAAYKRFKKSTPEYKRFVKDSSAWLEDYALYMAVKKNNDMKAWTEWEDEDIKLRKPEAIAEYTKELKPEIDFWKFVQYIFYKQWAEFRAYVNSLGIKIMGDMPIYVAMDSSDTWANSDVFWLDEEKQPVCVAGCPPDYFSATGQLWGNPLYNWEHLKETNYQWWFARIKSAANLFDIVRIDHFRAFDSYYAIPFPAENAIGGEWLEGPGIQFFEKMREAIGDFPIVAEDLGLLTPGVIQLLKDSGYPGMKVLEFAFDSGEDNDYLPDHYTENSVVYSGTHDNDTIMGWFDTAKPQDIEFARSYCKLTEEEGYNWGIIRTAYASVSKYAIIQMQDILGLGSEARMNTPSTLGGNWVWRIKGEALTDELAAKLKALATTYNRLEENDQ